MGVPSKKRGIFAGQAGMRYTRAMFKAIEAGLELVEVCPSFGYLKNTEADRRMADVDGTCKLRASNLSRTVWFELNRVIGAALEESAKGVYEVSTYGELITLCDIPICPISIRVKTGELVTFLVPLWIAGLEQEVADAYYPDVDFALYALSRLANKRLNTVDLASLETLFNDVPAKCAFVIPAAEAVLLQMQLSDCDPDWPYLMTDEADEE